MVYKQRDKGKSWCQMVMAGAGQHYCLRWNNYQSNMTSVFHNLLQSEAFVDVTLACNESSLKAHKVVLSACSSYFQKLLLENPCKHPTIILPSDICFSDLKFIIEFVYRGEIDVSQAELQSLLRTADQLKIKGLCEVPEDEEANDTDESITAAELTLNTVRQLHHESSRRNTSHTKLRSRYTTHVKRKMHFDHSSHRKYTARDGKSYGNNDGEYVHASTINSNDILDNPTRHTYDNMQTDCTTVGTSTEDDEKDIKNNIEIPIVLLDSHQLSNDSMHHSQHKQTDQHIQQTDKLIMTDLSPIMSSSCSTLTTLQTQHHQIMLDHCHQRRNDENLRDDILPDPQPPGPTATPVHCHSVSPAQRDMGVDTSSIREDDFIVDETKVKFETLRAMDSTSDSMETLENHMSSDRSMSEEDHTMQTMMITPELLGLLPSSNSSNPPSEVGSDSEKCSSISKAWTQEDMDLALDALRNRHMSLTKASITYGIPSTTLWQRAHRLGIDTPKKDGPTKSWNEEVLNSALEALRTGTISANKASKAYGIPSSTLYKIARKEGIRLAAPFNAAPTSWHPEDLERALDAIRTGQISVQRAATEYGIPSGTLYGRCKREKIELSRSNPTPWSEDAMTEALETVRLGHMSINQAAIHYNLPYSSLYGRFKRGKYDADPLDNTDEVTPDMQSSPHTTTTTVAGTQTIIPQQMQPQQQTHQQSDPQQQQQQSDSQNSSPNMQSQMMLLQYQHTPPPIPPPQNHIPMYQSTAPS